MAFPRPLIALAAVGALAAMIFLPPYLRPVDACLVGDPEARLAATVPAELRDVRLDASRMRVGLGAAAVGGWEGLGDALAVGGQVWTRPTDRGSELYYRLLVNRTFQTNAFVYVPLTRAPAERLILTAGATAGEVIEQLAKAHAAGVIVAGYVRFAELHTLAIAEPAVAGVPVLQNAPRYYTRPMETARNAWAYVVGAAQRRTALDAGRPQALRPPRLLAPPAPPAKAASLLHALRLTGAPADPAAAPRPDQALNVGQVARDSKIAEGVLELYPVARAAACTDAYSTDKR